MLRGICFNKGKFRHKQEEIRRGSVKKNGTAVEEKESALWPEYLVTAQLHERDDPKDEVESSDLKPVAFQEFVARFGVCLGFACPVSSEYCDKCQVASIPPKPNRRILHAVRHSLREIQLDAYLAAPTSRGKRGTAAAHAAEKIIRF